MLTGNRLNPFKSIALHVLPVLRSEQEVGIKSLLLAGNSIGHRTMKMMRMYCPTCQAVARIGKTNRKHPQLYDVYCYCSNVECGHSFVMNVAFSHSVSPSALNGQGRVKELIDAIPPEEREKALKLLLAAQKNG